MRNRIVAGVVGVAFALLLGWYFLGQRAPAPAPVGGSSPSPADGDAPSAGEAAQEAPAALLRGASDAALPPVVEDIEETQAIPPEDRLTLTGRVVDDRRRPVPDLEVVVRQTGRPDGRTTTDVRGAFTLFALRPAEGRWHRVAVLALRGEDEVAVKEPGIGSSSPSTIDVGVLVLEQGHRLAVMVQNEDGTPAEANVALLTWTLQGHTVWARATTGADGRAVLSAVPDGPYRIVAWRAGSGRAVALVALPRVEKGPVVLRLPAERVVPVEVVYAESEAPAANVGLEVWETLQGNGWRAQHAYVPNLEVSPTDEAGRTEIRGLAPKDEAYVIVDVPGRTPPPAQTFGPSPHPVIEAETTKLRIELEALRVLEWPVTEDEGPVPADGTPLTLTPRPGAIPTSLPATAELVDGRIRAEGIGPGHVHGLARTPDGRIAPLFAAMDAEEGSPTSFRPSRTITVRVTYPDGEPATGLFVQARNQGNNPLHEPIALDPEGRASISGLYGRLAEVYVLQDAGNPHGGRAIGSVGLAAGDGDVAGTVARTRRGVLRVTIDGEPRLPGRYSLYTGGGVADVVEEDPETGEIHFLWRPVDPAGPGPLRFWAGDYLIEAEPAPLPGMGAEPDVSQVALASGGSLIATVTLPPDGRISIIAQRWDPDAMQWVQGASYGGPGAQIGPDGRQRFGPLADGRYRVIAPAIGLTSEEVDVEAWSPPAAVSLDCSKAGWARGTVEVPEGYDVTTVRVRLDGIGQTRSNRATIGGAGVWKSGGFGIRIPGSKPVTLVPVHATLEPAPEGGTVTVTETREDIVLRLVEGNVAELRLDPPPVFPSHARERKVAIRLYDGPAEGEPVHRVEAPCAEGVVRFGGFTPGTYTVWIDAPGFAPAVLPARHLAAGRNDLGDVTLSPGSVVTIRILVPEGQAPPRVGVAARRVGEPAYLRFTSSRGEAEVVLPGLGAGRFKLQVYGQMGLSGAGRGGLEEEVIEVDGESPLERTLDLR